MVEVALLDTHAVLWWTGGESGRLGRDARRFVEAVDLGRAVACISTLSLVEISEQVNRGRIRLPEPFEKLVVRLESTPGRYLVVPLVTRDPEIAAAIGAERLW